MLRQLPQKDFILEKELKVDFASCRIFAQVFGLKQLAEIEELGRGTFDLEQLALLEHFVSQGIIRADTVQDAFVRVMRTLKHCMFDMGLKASYRTMETEELYRGPPTVARLRVVLAKTQNTARARRDLKKTLLKVFRYEQMLPQLRAVLSQFLPENMALSEEQRKEVTARLEDERGAYTALAGSLVQDINKMSSYGVGTFLLRGENYLRKL